MDMNLKVGQAVMVKYHRKILQFQKVQQEIEIILQTLQQIQIQSIQ